MLPRNFAYAAAIIAVLTAAGRSCLADETVSDVRKTTSDLATPSGITLQSVGKGRTANAYAYADAKGMFLYTYDKDKAGRSTCSGDCAKNWIPAIAPPHAKLSVDWSLTPHQDGSMQWVFKGKPLYRFVNDEKIGDGKGDGVDGVWHLASFQPAVDLVMPNGFAVQEIADASGQALVDARGKTLYVFDGKVGKGKSACGIELCASPWEPVFASELANPIGDWTVVSRNDGIQQWSFKGRPLYTFDGDIQAGDANGVGVDKHWQVALVARYFTPKKVSIRQLAGHGTVLVTAEGMTLYRRDRYLFGGSSYSSRPDTLPLVPAVGRAIGTQGCDAECLKTWRPLTAPPDAQPSGFWDVAIRDDGTRQWVYHGYALYTYAGDKKPGDLNGNGLYDILVKADGRSQINDFGTSAFHAPSAGANAPALYWAFAFP